MKHLDNALLLMENIQVFLSEHSSSILLSPNQHVHLAGHSQMKVTGQRGWAHIPTSVKAEIQLKFSRTYDDI